MLADVKQGTWAGLVGAEFAAQGRVEGGRLHATCESRNREVGCELLRRSRNEEWKRRKQLVTVARWFQISLSVRLQTEKSSE